MEFKGLIQEDEGVFPSSDIEDALVLDLIDSPYEIELEEDYYKNHTSHLNAA